jgi:NAD(P)-dependent dehydrogenase (short-subunit alcohol dehydrogenase family)
MNNNLDGNVVVVTGAGSGIGRETALLCARRGATLAICDVDEAGLEQTAAGVRALGRDVLAERVDVADAERMRQFAAAVHERFDGVDLLVNNAGIGVLAKFLETEPVDWERQISINLMGVVHGCQSFLPRMVQRARGGHVVNVSSQAGFQANPALAAYSTTKFAVFGLSEALRIELRAHQIGVTVVCPGVVNTSIIRTGTIRGDHAHERQDKLVRLYTRRGYGPEKVAVRILQAVQRNRAVAPITPEAHIGYLLTRIAPPIARWVSAKLSAVTE